MPRRVASTAGEDRSLQGLPGMMPADLAARSIAPVGYTIQIHCSQMTFKTQGYHSSDSRIKDSEIKQLITIILLVTIVAVF